MPSLIENQVMLPSVPSDMASALAVVSTLHSFVFVLQLHVIAASSSPWWSNVKLVIRNGEKPGVSINKPSSAPRGRSS